MFGQKFGLGHIVATPGALDRAKEHGISLGGLLRRHAGGDWGDLDAHDLRENERALKTGARILSAYGKGDQKIWIITDAAYFEEAPLARATTTILLPSEY
jgi:hypothetical protein